jgi:hypothetical protein
MRFSEEYSKLRKKEFTTIRKNTGYYKVGSVRRITTPRQEFRAKVISSTPLAKRDITEELARKDADCSRDKLIEMLERWYGRRFDDFALLRLRRVA